MTKTEGVKKEFQSREERVMNATDILRLACESVSDAEDKACRLATIALAEEAILALLRIAIHTAERPVSRTTSNEPTVDNSRS